MRCSFDLENKTWVFDFLIPELDCRCDYQLDGKVLLLPIKGEGNCTIVFGESLFFFLFYEGKGFVCREHACQT